MEHKVALFVARGIDARHLQQLGHSLTLRLIFYENKHGRARYTDCIAHGLYNKGGFSSTAKTVDRDWQTFAKVRIPHAGKEAFKLAVTTY